MTCKFPAIPFPSGVDQNLQRILAPIKETLDIWAGRQGSDLCRVVTIEDLLDEAVTVNITGSGGGVTDHGALTGLADDDHTQYQLRSEKSAASGYASLGSNTLVPTAELGTGTAGNTTYLRGDQTWATISTGGGDYNIDGGRADSVYTPQQLIDGGSASG